MKRLWSITIAPPVFIAVEYWALKGIPFAAQTVMVLGPPLFVVKCVLKSAFQKHSGFDRILGWPGIIK